MVCRWKWSKFASISSSRVIIPMQWSVRIVDGYLIVLLPLLLLFPSLRQLWRLQIESMDWFVASLIAQTAWERIMQGATTEDSCTSFTILQTTDDSIFSRGAKLLAVFSSASGHTLNDMKRVMKMWEILLTHYYVWWMIASDEYNNCSAMIEYHDHG